MLAGADPVGVERLHVLRVGLAAPLEEEALGRGRALRDRLRRDPVALAVRDPRRLGGDRDELGRERRRSSRAYIAVCMHTSAKHHVVGTLYGGIGNTKPLFTRVFSTDRVRTPVPPCRLVPAPGVGPHAQRRTPWRAHRQGVQGVP